MRLRVIAPTLAAVAGFIDAVGFITLHGLFVAHMSGNSIKLGVLLGRGALSAAAPVAFAVAVFVLGVALGTAVAEIAARRRTHAVASPVLALQAALLAAFMLYGRTLLVDHVVPGRRLSGFYVLAALAIVSMGMQTAALRQLGGRTISTTYVTGVLTSLTQEVVNIAFWMRDGRHREERHSFLTRVLGLGSQRDSGRRAAILAAVWLAYTAGGVLGSYCDARVTTWSLLVPLAALLVVIAVDMHRPIEL